MQMLFKTVSAILLSVVILPSTIAAEEIDQDRQVASINGDPIMASELLTYAKVKNPTGNLQDDAIRKQMIQAYVARELLYQEAVEQKLDKLPLVQLALENQRHEVISQAMMAKIMSENPVSDKEVREFYDQKVKEIKNDEFSNPLPTFEEISPQIKRQLLEKTVAEYIQALQKKAKIEIGDK